ncbi:helix-turn-helix transcriptional regulator [Modestobacter lacusdianchii]
MADLNRELADFLRRARGAIDPARAGLPADARVRRVPGLRREEVALLAGVSTDYYTRLEQGRRITPSPGVVDAIARALDLDDAGRAHLGHLIGPASPARVRRTPVVQRARPGLHQFLDALDPRPALVLGRRTDVLASNRMARALFTDFEQLRPRERNYARWMLLSEEARELFLDWEEQARAAVENLRLALGEDPGDRAARELVEELAERSPEFRAWWEGHRVHQRTSGSKRLRHPVVGELTVEYETLTLPGDPGQTLFVYTAGAGTASGQALDLLASWTSSPGRGDPRAEAGQRP